MLLNTSPLTLVESEELLYSLSSFIAEVGGVMGLFLGFSFMAIWEAMEEFTSILGKKLGRQVSYLAELKACKAK